MFKLKLLLKNEKIKTVLIAMALSLIFIIFNHSLNVYRNFSDFFCVMGLIHFFIGSTRYIRNVGLFKTFSYLAYKNRWKSNARIDGSLHCMSLAEYTQTVIMDETRHLPVAWVMCTGVVCFSIALLLAFLMV